MRSVKSIALIILLLCCLSSVGIAEPALTKDITVGKMDAYDLTMVLPDGYTVAADHSGLPNCYFISSPEEDTPDYRITFSYMEEYSGLSSYDMSEEDFELLSGMLQEEFNAPSVSFSQTDEGSRLIIMDEDGSESDFVTITTLYKGYFVQIYLSRPDYGTLSEQDIQTGIQLMNDTHIMGL